MSIRRTLLCFLKTGWPRHRFKLLGVDFSKDGYTWSSCIYCDAEAPAMKQKREATEKSDG